MHAKPWTLEVTEIGSAAPVFRVEVAASNWVAALKAGRAQAGETGGVPRGSSCAIAADGTVTLYDPVSLRTYRLCPSPVGLDTVIDSRTHDPNSDAEALPLSLMDDETIVDHAAPALPLESRSGSDWELFHERDVRPSEDNPLTYRERAYVVAPDMHPRRLEAILFERWAYLRDSMSPQDRPRSQHVGQLVKLAMFDSRWKDVPQRPPMATLEWRDWGGEPVIRFPSDVAAHTTAATTAASSTQRTGKPIAQPEQKASDAEDARLARAFEACQDFLFFETPVEGLAAILTLLEELIPTEASSACLYDIDADVFRFAVVRGTGAEERQGSSVPARTGLFGAAGETLDKVLLVQNPDQESRFDPAADARRGLQARSLVYLPLSHQGRLLGVLQLINRQRESAFSQTDLDVLDYIGKQLSSFLYQSRISLRPSPRESSPG